VRLRCAAAGDAALLRRYEAAAARLLEWIDGAADADGDGFVEYDTRSPVGQKNQGWKDSSLAIVDEDGRGVPNPLATCELQGYVYAGKQQYAVALALGLRRYRDALALLRDASRLKRRFAEAFWMPRQRFIAMALDSRKRQVRSISSNPGHCLATGIVGAEHARAVAGRLMAQDMFSGWGVRTLSSRHPSFNPLSYQLGSVWPVENASIAFGLKRYGFDSLANDIARSMFDAAALFPHHRLPEVLGGFPRDAAHPHPGVYPRAQSPQAWSASALSLLVQTMLGLRPFAPFRLLLVDPDLPAWLPDLTLRGLRVGGATLDIRFHRERDGTTGWKVLRLRGPPARPAPAA
jgi:glycogen debranching enzyme